MTSTPVPYFADGGFGIQPREAVHQAISHGREIVDALIGAAGLKRSPRPSLPRRQAASVRSARRPAVQVAKTSCQSRVLASVRTAADCSRMATAFLNSSAVAPSSSMTRRALRASAIFIRHLAVGLVDLRPIDFLRPAFSAMGSM